MVVHVLSVLGTRNSGLKAPEADADPGIFLSLDFFLEDALLREKRKTRNPSGSTASGHNSSLGSCVHDERPGTHPRFSASSWKTLRASYGGDVEGDDLSRP